MAKFLAVLSTLSILLAVASGDDTGEVVSCSRSRECPPITPVCDKVAGVCVECLANANCADRSDSATLCNIDAMKCAECRANQHCMGPGYMAMSPICVIDPSSGIPGDCTACASHQECIEAFGARAPFCAPTGACVPCLANANCPDMDNAFCDVGATFMCVPCRADQHCEEAIGPGYICDAGSCVQAGSEEV